MQPVLRSHWAADRGMVRQSTEGMSRTILTADDSASMREMVRFTLRNAGYDVAEAVDSCRHYPALPPAQRRHLRQRDALEGGHLLHLVDEFQRRCETVRGILREQTLDDRAQPGRSGGCS